MRISTPVNKQTLKHHFDYYKWKYILMIVIVVAACSLLYTVTRPQAPDHARITMYVQSDTTSEGLMHAFLDPVWEEAVPDEEELNLWTISKNDHDTALQQLFTYVYSNEGDIYILSNRYFRQYAATGTFVPLETLIDDGRLNVDGLDVRAGWADLVLERDENDVPTQTESHLYGIPMKELYGFLEMQVYGDDLYLCIAVDNGNMDDVITFFNAMIQYARAEKPEMLE